MAYTPTVWSNGDVITADKLNKLESGVANEQAGPAGPAGSAATVAVGTVTTGEAGTDASVTNSGTESAAVLDFVIPKGAAGTNGADGAAGAAGASIRAIELYTNETGGVTGGKATLTDDSEITITVTTTPAG